MTTANTRTTKLQTQFEPAAKVTVFTHDRDDKANVLVINRVAAIIHAVNGIQLQTDNQETVFVAWDHVKYFLTGPVDE